MVSFHDLAATRCEKIQAPSYVNLALSIIILLGILVSYLPQHHRIISRQTSEGISPYFVLLGTTSSTSGFANILVLPASRADVACCKTVSAFECFTGLLGIAQVGTQWFCFTVILLLFLIFFPRNPTFPENRADRKPSWRTALTVAFICLLHGLLVIFVSAALFMARPAYLSTWANILGIMSAALAAIQYFPQIWTTWHLGHVGSLSIPMMVIQTPGSFVWAGSLAARLGVEGWSSWGVYVVTGCLQGCLLGMGIYFELKARQQKQIANGRGSPNPPRTPDGLRFSGGFETDDEGHPVVENGRPRSERTPLIRKPSRA